jgi:hypothetical protein
MPLPHEKIEASLDRFKESHWWIHQMEDHYHFADPFRYSFNAFIRSLKEIPQLIKMELQNEKDFKSWFKDKDEALKSDPLISFLSKKRDLVVHRGMLVPLSKAFIGITEGRGMKRGLSFDIHPLEDSDEAMSRYLEVAKGKGDFLQLLFPDEESLPCIMRQWRIEEFKDTELWSLSIAAWQKVGEVLSVTLEWLGGSSLDLSLSCRHSRQNVYIRMYDRDRMRDTVGAA